jgi:2-C-methyl-D-erythritol 4-phosphate cytidylyltransferase/2-C-methyl-D-erythritol 2,4-cyclodiphosphate synthase
MAGNSSRYKPHDTTKRVNKVLDLVNGLPLYKYSLDILSKYSNDIILVVNQDNYNFVLSDVSSKYKVIVGGNTRGESSYKAILEAKGEFVLIHDGARPLITRKLVDAMLYNINDTTHSIICIKKQTSALFDLKIGAEVMDRENYYIIETPQIFNKEIIKEAYLRDLDNNLRYNDDLSVYLKYYPSSNVYFYNNEELNIKVTVSSDLDSVDKILSQRKLVYGTSYDVHQLVQNRPLILGGIKLDYPLGLLGVSDADVISHAIASAILGSLGKRDLGYYFNDQDIVNIGVKSSKILKNIYNIMVRSNYYINNIDVMVILQAPKIATKIEQMCQYYMKLLNINRRQISIKATTNEYLGLIGQSKAIAVKCIVSLRSGNNDR